MIAWRHYILVGLFLAMIGALCVRVVYLGVTQKNFLQQQGDARSVRREVMPAMRGAIVDRNGEPLAVSTPVFSVWIDPSRAEVSATTLHKVARLLGLQGDTVARRLADNQRREHLVLARRVRWDVAERLRALKIKHLYLDNEYRRYYPAAETTAHVVGVTDIKDQGAEGVEYALNDRLSGKHGAKIVLKDQLGQTIRDLEYIAAPVYGQEVKLTLDQRLQYVAYSELKSAVQSHKAKSGSLVMVDARNGDILALVNQPSYNPNDIPEKMLGMRNRAVTDPYEPGSTIKPFTALAALESGHFKADTLIDTHPGFFHVGKKLIEDPVNRKVISLSQAIQKSSQVAIAKVAMDLPEDAVFDVLSRAGLGDYLGSGLPGEVMGYFASDQLRYPVVQATFSYGYGLSVTPLQLAHAYLTLATFGEKMPLSILHGTPRRRERVFDHRVVAEVVGMMEQVTTVEGTASQAAVPGYRVAGKTGTARIFASGSYDDERHVAWFAGMVPASDPRVVMVVTVNEPSAGLSGGGVVAAPIFGRVAQKTLLMLGVVPDQQIAGVSRLEAGGAI